MLHLGVDIAKLTFTAACFYQDQVRDLGSFPNDETGFERLVQSLPPTSEGVTLTLEPTAGYELPLALFAYERGFRVQMPQPKRVREWGDGMGVRAKTDRQDARLLARFGAAGSPSEWKPLPAEVMELDLLLERQRDLQKQIRQERNRLDALEKRPHVPEAVRRSIRGLIGSLEEAEKEIQAEIQTHLKTHSALKEEARRLRSVPGIGERNGLQILLLLYRCASFLSSGEASGKKSASGKKLVAYVGLDPQLHESGTSVRRRKGISRKGDREVRRLLYLGALGGVRGKNPLKTYYERLVHRGKPKKVALLACARKLLLWAGAVFLKKETFDPTRAAHFAQAVS